MMFLMLAQATVAHDRTELYAVIGTLCAVIVYQERRRIRAENIAARAVEREEQE